MSHTFHIPVLGLGYSVDTPLKVARFGISSTASIVDDMLIERMRKYHTELRNTPKTPKPRTIVDALLSQINISKFIIKQMVEAKSEFRDL